MHEPVVATDQTSQQEHEQMLRAVAAVKAELAQTMERVDRVLERLRAKLGERVLRIVGKT